MEREFVFKSLVGPYNYNLLSNESSESYKVFVLPNFNDLYVGHLYSSKTIKPRNPEEYYDIRNCLKYWYKGDFYFLETLFSKDIVINDELDSDSLKEINTILQLKDYIARMNLPALYKSCINISKKNKIDMRVLSSDNRITIGRYGYDTFKAAEVLRILDFLRRFADGGFDDFQDALCYKDGASKRDMLLDVISGGYTLEQVDGLISVAMENIETNYKSLYLSGLFNKKTYDSVNECLCSMFVCSLKSY